MIMLVWGRYRWFGWYYSFGLNSLRVRCGREESSALDFIFECGEVSKKEMDPSQWKDFDNTHADAASCKRLYVGLFVSTYVTAPFTTIFQEIVNFNPY